MTHCTTEYIIAQLQFTNVKSFSEGVCHLVAQGISGIMCTITESTTLIHRYYYVSLVSKVTSTIVKYLHNQRPIVVRIDMYDQPMLFAKINWLGFALMIQICLSQRLPIKDA